MDDFNQLKSYFLTTDPHNWQHTGIELQTRVPLSGLCTIFSKNKSC